MSPFRAYVPDRLEEALTRLAEDPALVPIAGCTDLMTTDRETRVTLTRVLNLLEIGEIRGIEVAADHLRVGAATTFTEIRRSPEVLEHAPMLAAAAEQIGGWQIQNRATIGGNLANGSPAGDSPPVLLALDASLVLARKGETREIPYIDFHVGYRKTALRPGELIAWIKIPRGEERPWQRFRKVGTRRAQAIAKVVVALAARRRGGKLTHVRIGAGSVAERPLRLRATEEILTGQKLSRALAEKAGRAARGEVTPIDDVRSTAAYRSYVLERVVRRLVLEISA